MNQFEMKQSAYRSQLKSRALQVLLYLIDRANKEQTCFPAVPTIGRELHISISTVKRAMRELVEAGYVAKKSRFREGNRGQTSNLYTLHFPEEEGAMKEENIMGEAVASEYNVSIERREQAGAETLFRPEKDTESQEGNQDNESVGNESTTKITDRVNGADTVSEVEYVVAGVINHCTDKGNCVRTGNPADIRRIGVRGHTLLCVSGETLGKIGGLLRKGMGTAILIFQWPGEGVNLIPP